MSSAVAMNRKITSQGGETLTSDEYMYSSREYMPSNKSNMTNQSSRISGTPVQQCWQVLNYHEKRFNNLDDFLKVHSKQNVTGFQSISSQTEILSQKLVALETRLHTVNVLEHELKELKNELLDIKNTQTLSSNTQTLSSNKQTSKKSKKGSVQLEVTEE